MEEVEEVEEEEEAAALLCLLEAGGLVSVLSACSYLASACEESTMYCLSVSALFRSFHVK